MARIDGGRGGCLGAAVEDVAAETAGQDVVHFVAADLVVAAAADAVLDHRAVGHGDVVGVDSGRAEAALAQIQHGGAGKARKIERVVACPIPDAEAHRGIEIEIVRIASGRAVEAVGRVGGACRPVDPVLHLDGQDVVQTRCGEMGERSAGVLPAPVRHVGVLAAVVEMVSVGVDGRVAVVVARVVETEPMAQLVHEQPQRVGAGIHRLFPGDMADLDIAAALAGKVGPAAAIPGADAEHVGDVGIVGVGRLDERDAADVGIEPHGCKRAGLRGHRAERLVARGQGDAHAERVGHLEVGVVVRPGATRPNDVSGRLVGAPHRQARECRANEPRDRIGRVEQEPLCIELGDVGSVSNWKIAAVGICILLMPHGPCGGRGKRDRCV